MDDNEDHVKNATLGYLREHSICIGEWQEGRNIMKDEIEMTSLEFYLHHIKVNAGSLIGVYNTVEMKILADEILRLEALIRNKDNELDLASKCIADLQEEQAAWQMGWDDGYARGMWDAGNVSKLGEVVLKAKTVSMNEIRSVAQLLKEG